jgi:hypothetical protein
MRLHFIVQLIQYLVPCFQTVFTILLLCIAVSVTLVCFTLQVITYMPALYKHVTDKCRDVGAMQVPKLYFVTPYPALHTFLTKKNVVYSVAVIRYVHRAECLRVIAMILPGFSRNILFYVPHI